MPSRLADHPQESVMGSPRMGLSLVCSSEIATTDANESRHLRFRWSSVAALLSLVASIGSLDLVRAQGAVRSVHGDWQIRCDTPPGAQSEQCALIQSVVAEDRSNAGLTVIVLKTADQKSRLMRVVAPLGVLLPSGLGLKHENQ